MSEPDDDAVEGAEYEVGPDRPMDRGGSGCAEAGEGAAMGELLGVARAECCRCKYCTDWKRACRPLLLPLPPLPLRDRVPLCSSSSVDVWLTGAGEMLGERTGEGERAGGVCSW